MKRAQWEDVKRLCSTLKKILLRRNTHANLLKQASMELEAKNSRMSMQEAMEEEEAAAAAAAAAAAKAKAGEEGGEGEEGGPPSLFRLIETTLTMLQKHASADNPSTAEEMLAVLERSHFADARLPLPQEQLPGLSSPGPCYQLPGSFVEASKAEKGWRAGGAARVPGPIEID